ncbi:MAG: hypothetical protein ABIG89_06275 [Candidatus Woesearchaeota archaeon]
MYTKDRKHKKAQGLSLNVVASAVIVLTVIIVLIIIFTGKLSLFSSNISGCEAKPGAKCVVGIECPDSKTDSVYYSQKLTFNCAKGSVCCYSQCKAAGGRCDTSCGDKESLGSADCSGGELCCK